MSKKIAREILFVIGRVDFQYNDETYNESEGGGTTPVNAYRSREKADAECLEANIKALKEWDIAQFGYSMDEIFNDTDAAERLFKAVGYEGDFDDFYGAEEWTSKMTKAQKKELLGYLNVSFFRVNEVELGD